MPEARREDAIAPSLGESPTKATSKPRKKPEIALPDGFPDAEARDDARNRAAAERADLAVDREAERFRNHALQVDRRARDWRAAWRNWVIGAIEKAPKRPAPAIGAAPKGDRRPFPSDGVRAIVIKAKGEPFARSWLDRCDWRDGDKVILCPSQFVADRLRLEVPALEAKGATIMVGANTPAQVQLELVPDDRSAA